MSVLIVLLRALFGASAVAQLAPEAGRAVEMVEIAVDGSGDVTYRREGVVAVAQRLVAQGADPNARAVDTDARAPVETPPEASTPSLKVAEAPELLVASERDKAKAFLRQGHPELALPIYDKLTATGSRDVQIYQDAFAAAMGAHDFHKAALYSERQLQIEPDNFAVIEALALPYHLAGDVDGFKRARDRAFRYRLTTTDPRILSNRLLFDFFELDNLRVFANECYQADAPLRVKYRFDIHERDSTAPAGQVFRSYIVLENSEADDKVALELTGDKRPHFSVDAFEENKTVHRTIQPYIGEPSYQVVKSRVAQYLREHKAVSSSSAPAGRTFIADCSPITKVK